MNSPTGKGMMIWQIKLSYGGNPLKYAEAALEMGLSYVSIKVANAQWKYNLRPPLWRDDLVGPLVEQLRMNGIRVGGWHYLFGKSPTGEADRAAERIEKFDLDFYELDVESHYKQLSANKRGPALDAFFRRLRSHVGGEYPLGNCSYRYPSKHPEIPWRIFLQHTDYHAPQVYWIRAHNPGEQLAATCLEYRKLERVYGIEPRPIYPVGAAFEERGWYPSFEELDEFDSIAQQLNLPGVMWYRWGHDYAGAQAHAYDRVIADHDWDGGAIPPEPPLPPTSVPLFEWAQDYADPWMREQGYDGPTPGVTT